MKFHKEGECFSENNNAALGVIIKMAEAFLWYQNSSEFLRYSI